MPEDVDAQQTGSLRKAIGRTAVASAIAVVLGELITFGQTIALARLLTPATVGLFVAGTVLTNFLTNFVEGGLRSALVHRADHLADATETVFRMSLLGGLLASTGALAAAPIIAAVFDSTTAGIVAAVSSGVLLLFAVTNVPEAMLQRTFNVKRRLIVGPLVSITFAAVAVTLAALGCGVWSMVAGMYVSNLVWVASVWILTDWRPGRGHFSFGLWRELARFGSPLLIGNIATRTGDVVTSAVVGRGLDSASLGNYRYGQRISMIPVRFVVEVGSASLFPAFSRIADDSARLSAAYVRALRWVTFAAVPLTGLMVVLGQPAVVVVFGEPWRAAGGVVVALAAFGLGRAWMSVNEEVIKGAGGTKLLNWQSAADLVLGLGFLLALIGPFRLVGVGVATSLTSLSLAALMLWLAHNIVKVSVWTVLRAISLPIPPAVGAAIIVWFLEHNVLRSDTREIALGIGYLTLDTLVFVLIYLGLFSAVAPSTVRPLWHLAITRLRRVNGPAKDE